MKNDLDLGKSLFEVTAMTFEELGFMLPVPELTEEQAKVSAEMAVEVAFHGPFRGKLLLQICGGIVPLVAANMLGSEEAPSVRMQQDAVGELTNVVCGNLLPIIGGVKEVFHIDAPNLVDLKASLAGVASGRHSAEAHVGIEQGRVDAFLFLDK